MIESGFAYLAALLFTIAVIVQLDKKFEKFFSYVPGIVVIYFLVMTFSTMGLWKPTDEVNLYYKHAKDNILPVMIFLMLLRCDLKKIFRLGPRMLLGFFSASVTIGAGFVVTYYLFRGYYEPHTWKTFAALSGSWMGGTGNMAAIQVALGVSDSQMGYTLLMDSVTYSVWVMVLLAIVPYAHRFNVWAGADTGVIDQIGQQLTSEAEQAEIPMSFAHLSLLLGSAMFFAAVSRYLASFLPESAFLNANTWTILIITFFGITSAMTRLGQTPGISQLGSMALYIIVALVGSRANFSELSQAPLYIFSGFVILFVHVVLLGLAARLFKLDMFTCGVASLANIGGVASAPILAAAYSEALVPIGILMGMLGYVVGTGGGLLVGKILSFI